MKFSITWFVFFGLSIAGMIFLAGHARDAALALLSYYLGGMVWAMLSFTSATDRETEKLHNQLNNAPRDEQPGPRRS